MYCRVSPFQGTFDRFWLSYYIPENLRDTIHAWYIVQVPFKEQQILAVVLEIVPEIYSDIDPTKIKDVTSVDDTQLYLLPYQRAIVDFISQKYITPIHNALWVFFPRNLREKIQKDTFKKVTAKAYSYEYNQPSKLTPEQQKTMKTLQESPNKKILFYGITGSGKTEIYTQLIHEQIQKGNQALLLIPEIILSSQIGERLRQVFGADVLLISSDVSEAKKTQYWRDIESGNAKIIVGTRSAVFYPYTNLWLIIVDEEHDQSYVSDSAPRYSTRDVVLEMSESLDIPVILASGTPSVESMYRAMKWEYELVNLLEKYKI